MPARVNHGWLEVDTVEDLVYEKLLKESYILLKVVKILQESYNSGEIDLFLQN